MSKKQKWYTNLYNLLSEFMFLTTLYKTTLLKHIKMLKQNQINQTKKKQLHQNSKLPSFCSSCVISLFVLFNLSISFTKGEPLYYQARSPDAPPEPRAWSSQRLGHSSF